MPKISNKTEYPSVTSGTIALPDFLIGTQNSTGLTVTFPISVIKALIEGGGGSGVSFLTVNIEDANTYQSNSLIGATNVWLYFNGQEMETAGLLAEDFFDSDTGTVTFNTDYAPFNGELKLFYY